MINSTWLKPQFYGWCLRNLNDVIPNIKRTNFWLDGQFHNKHIYKQFCRWQFPIKGNKTLAFDPLFKPAAAAAACSQQSISFRFASSANCAWMVGSQPRLSVTLNNFSNYRKFQNKITALCNFVHCGRLLRGTLLLLLKGKWNSLHYFALMGKFINILVFFCSGENCSVAHFLNNKFILFSFQVKRNLLHGPISGIENKEQLLLDSHSLGAQSNCFVCVFSAFWVQTQNWGVETSIFYW